MEYFVYTADGGVMKFNTLKNAQMFLINVLDEAWISYKSLRKHPDVDHIYTLYTTLHYKNARLIKTECKVDENI